MKILRKVEITGKYNWEFDGISNKGKLLFSNHNSGLVSFENVTMAEAVKHILKTGIVVYRKSDK